MNYNKYGAKKTVLDGIKFDSIAESRYYSELKLRKRAGDIEDFELQPEFEIQEKFRDSDGNSIRAIKYRGDFLVHHNNGLEEIIDVKGIQTPEFKLKWKLLKHKFGGRYQFTIVN